MQKLLLNKFLKEQSRRKKKIELGGDVKELLKRQMEEKNLKVRGHRFAHIAYKKTQKIKFTYIT